VSAKVRRVTTRALIVTLFALLSFPGVAAATPTVTLDVTPNPAHKGDRLTATATIERAGKGLVIGWRIDGAPFPKANNMSEIPVTFKDLGAHTIEVGVADETTQAGNPVTATKTVLVQNAAPVAAIAQSPATPVTGEPITISSASTDADGDPLLCIWDLNGDDTFETPGCSVTRTIPKAGTFNVSLKVTDGTATDTVTRTVTVANRPPVARIAPVTDVLTGDEITLDGRGSGDPDGSIVAGGWDLDGDGDFDDAAGPLATVTFDTAGDHTVALQVVDDNGAAAVTSAVITVGQGAVAAAAGAPPPGPAGTAKIGATLRYAFTRTSKATMFTSLLVRNLPVGAKVKATCKGGGCAAKAFTAVAKSDTMSLKTLIRRKLKAGAAITVVVTKPGMVTRTIVVTVRKGKDPKVAGK
jgi:PKD repeat protein